MASAGLDNEPGRGKHGGELGEYLRRPLQINASGEYQYRRAECGDRLAVSRGIKGAVGSEATGRGLVGLRLAPWTW